MANKKQKVTIYWNTRHIKLEDIPEVKRRIRERFGIPNHTTVNGETDCYIREEDMELLRETEKRGFIQIRNKPALDYSFSYFSACTISYRQFLLPENGVKMAKFLFA